MVSFVQLVVFAIIVGLSSFVVDRLKDDTSEKKTRKNSRHRTIINRVCVSIAAALIAIIANKVMVGIGKYLERPSLDIHTSNSGDLISFRVKVPRGAAIERIALNYPVLGVIGELNDLTDVTVARTAVARAVGGSTEGAIENNFEMIITDIESGQTLEYKLGYTPYGGPWSVAGTDEYRLSYVWRYQGESIEESEWRSVKNDQIVGKPPIITQGVEIYNRALTPEEIKKHFREGPPKRSLE
jgi:hypothetical protein